MVHKKALEALDRTLKDLRGNEKLFSGRFQVKNIVKILHLTRAFNQWTVLLQCLQPDRLLLHRWVKLQNRSPLEFHWLEICFAFNQKAISSNAEASLKKFMFVLNALVDAANSRIRMW